MFPHHSDQMSQRLKVSKIALWKCSLNVFLVVEGRLKPSISKQIHLVFIWNGGAALQLPPLGICILLSQFLMTTAMLMIKMVCIYYIKMIMMLLLVLMMILVEQLLVKMMMMCHHCVESTWWHLWVHPFVFCLPDIQFSCVCSTGRPTDVYNKTVVCPKPFLI